MNIEIKENVLLAPYTSLNCGGVAEKLVVCDSSKKLKEIINSANLDQIKVLGYGTNSLISDSGLPGLIIITKGGEITTQDTTVVADAGVWWDQMVKRTIENNLWGLEMTSGIPGGVGAAVIGNIAAYGQKVSDRLIGVEVIDILSKKIIFIEADQLGLEYRSSKLQNQPNLVVLNAKFQLSENSTTNLNYDSALKVLHELNLNEDSLTDRRQAILETRRRAGSLYNPEDKNKNSTAGSFFKNPIVSHQQAVQIAKFDETGKTLERVLEQNKIHGGDSTRVSAAHVLLAAGFKRGQSWGKVRLHPEHVLKIENTGGASAQEIYNVANHIINTVHSKLSINLKPEVQFLGHFLDNQTV